MIEQLLLERGYRKYSGEFLHSYSDFFMQKRFDDERGVRYFLNFCHYPHHYEPNIDESWKAEMTSNSPHFTFQQHWVEDVELAERNVEQFFRSMHCDYYEKWEE